MDFGRAVGTAFSVGSNRKVPEGESDGAEEVSWAQGLTGVSILVIVQLALIFWGMGKFDGGIFRDLSIVAFGALLVPFIMFWLVSRLTGTSSRLPAAFLYLGIALAALQALSAVLSSFGTGQSGFLIGLLFAFVFLAARGFLKVGWPIALIMGLVAFAGFIGFNLLLLNLPTGQLLR